MHSDPDRSLDETRPQRHLCSLLRLCSDCSNSQDLTFLPQPVSCFPLGYPAPFSNFFSLMITTLTDPQDSFLDPLFFPFLISGSEPWLSFGIKVMIPKI